MITINDSDSPAPISFRDYFGTGGNGRNLSLYIQTEDGLITLPIATSGNSNGYQRVGGSYITFGLDSSQQTLIQGIDSGDRVIIALCPSTDNHNSDRFRYSFGDSFGKLHGKDGLPA